MDQPRPDVERVQSGRRTPVIVGVIAALVVGLLVWKPWDRPTTPPHAAGGPSATTGATPSPTGSGGPAVVASGRPFPPPSAGQTWGPLPTPDLAPLGPMGDFVLVTDDGGAVARCVYDRSGSQRVLRAISIQPPFVTVAIADEDETRDIKSVRWWVELQRNRLDTIFDSDWETVARSRRQLAQAISSRPADFVPLLQEVDGENSPPNSVYRVLVKVEWQTRNLETAGSDEALVGSYASTRRPGQIDFEGCRAVRTTV